MNQILKIERKPKEWKRGVMVTIFKSKSDVQRCSNYGSIKLTSDSMKL